MNEKALKTLEYDKIIDMLSRCASSPLGQARCRALTPSDDLSVIRSMQSQTSDALNRLFRKGSISFGNVKDIRPSLKRLAVGGSLNQMELLTIAGLLENAGRGEILRGGGSMRTELRTAWMPFSAAWSLLLHCQRKFAGASQRKMKSATMPVRLSARSGAPSAAAANVFIPSLTVC